MVAMEVCCSDLLQERTRSSAESSVLLLWLPCHWGPLQNSSSGHTLPRSPYSTTYHGGNTGTWPYLWDSGKKQALQWVSPLGVPRLCQSCTVRGSLTQPCFLLSLPVLRRLICLWSEDFFRPVLLPSLLSFTSKHARSLLLCRNIYLCFPKWTQFLLLGLPQVSGLELLYFYTQSLDELPEFLDVQCHLCVEDSQICDSSPEQSSELQILTPNTFFTSLLAVQ